MKMNLTENLLWWAAWRPRPLLVLGIVLGLGVAIASSSPFPFLLFVLLSVGFWICGTQLVNRNATMLLEEAEAQCRVSGANKLGIKASDGETFVLRGQTDFGRFPLISVAPNHTIAVLYATPSFLGIYAGTVVDLKERHTKFGSTTKELYYPHIAAVEYSAYEFRLVTTSGERIPYSTADNPEVGDAALNAVRQHLRKIHAAV
jgi:hypothetical protein